MKIIVLCLASCLRNCSDGRSQWCEACKLLLLRGVLLFCLCCHDFFKVVSNFQWGQHRKYIIKTFIWTNYKSRGEFSLSGEYHMQCFTWDRDGVLVEKRRSSDRRLAYSKRWRWCTRLNWDRSFRHHHPTSCSSGPWSRFSGLSWSTLALPSHILMSHDMINCYWYAFNMFCNHWSMTRLTLKLNIKQYIVIQRGNGAPHSFQNI